MGSTQSRTLRKRTDLREASEERARGPIIHNSNSNANHLNGAGNISNTSTIVNYVDARGLIAAPLVTHIR